MGDSARKRQKGLQGQSIDVSLKQPSSSTLPPALALFPSAQPPAKTPYTLYSTSSTPPNPDKRDPAVLAAETDEIEFESSNHQGKPDDGGDNEGYAVQYMIGVRNPRTNELTLHAAPLHTFTPIIKSLKASSKALSPAQLFTQQKAALGSAFGTRKAIKNLRTQERNKLSESSFGVGAQSTDLQSHLQASIAAASVSLPTAQAVEEAANSSRPIPPFNLDAATPNDVYDLSAVVSTSELNAVAKLHDFLAAPGFKERNALLPYRRSHFISTKLRQILPARDSVEGHVPNPGKKDRERLQLAIHLSYLFAFRQAARPGPGGIERAKVAEKLGNPSNAVVEALMERYTTETRGGGGGEIRKMTSTDEAKLLGYMLVLVLKIDGWSTDIATIADDLGMGSKKVQEIFRSLGCVATPPSAVDREKMVATGQASTAAEAAKSKKAVLKVPLKFPVERKVKAKR